MRLEVEGSPGFVSGQRSKNLISTRYDERAGGTYKVGRDMTVAPSSRIVRMYLAKESWSMLARV